MKTYQLIVTSWIILLLSYTPVLALQSWSASAEENPNVILVMTDDQGYGDLGLHGNQIIETPNLDSFFRESVRATNFHVSPTCSPTRGALMTGRHTNRVGTWHTIAGRSLLYEDETVLPQIFAENGYTTGMFGKWHLGDNYPYRPEDRGFQQVVRHSGGGIAQGNDFWGNNYFDDTLWFNGEPRQTEGYITDVLFDETIKFIKAHNETPFFVYLPLNAAHGPFHVPEKFYNLYKNEDQLLEVQKRFYGMITNIDHNFGRLDQQLQELGLLENTIVIFMTDNGSARGYRQEDGESYGFNAGLRGIKGSQYEGGHRVPFAIRWPDGNIGGDKKIDELLAHIDLLPTLVELADLRFVPTKKLDGKSFAMLLQEEASNWDINRTLIVDSQRVPSLVKWRRSSVMDDTWRLVDGRELYNIREDLGQEHDVAAEHPAVVRRLRESYNTWWTSLIKEGVNQKYAYIKAGSRYENPVRVSSHDMQIYPNTYAWHQHGSLLGAQGQGILKLEIVQTGRYRIDLRRYPPESGLSFNQSVPAEKETIEISSPMPASKQLNLSEATLFLADIGQTKPIPHGAESVSFEGYLPAGRYDMTAFFSDEQGRRYPSYYTVIEKISD